MSKTVVSTQHAPGAIGPYSQAIVANGMVFCSGQIALDPATGSMQSGGVELETPRVLDNLKAVLAEAGASLEDVVKTTIFLADLNDFQKVNEIYGRYFGEQPPARATVGVASLPRGARVEIDAIAVLKS